MSPNNIIATHAIVGWTTIQPTDEPHHLLQSQEVPAYRLSNSHGEVIGSNSVYSFGENSFVAVAGWPVWEDAEMAKIALSSGHAEAFAIAYQTYGKNLLDYVRGPFSFALFDGTKNQLLAAIDRLGLHTLYYIEHESKLIFGMSAGAVFNQLGASKKLSEQGIYDYVYFHMVPSPQSVYQGLKKLPAAHCLEYSSSGIEVSRYWSPNFNDRTNRSFDSMGDELKIQLRKSVAKTIEGNPSVGTFLSGGLDSSTVTGVLAELTDGSKPAYAIGFDEEGFDEMAFARETASHFGVKLQEYYVTPQDVLEELPTIARSYDEPFGNSSALPAYFCAKRAAQDGVKCLLAGDGGDEIFAGNERYGQQRVFNLYAGVPAFLRNSFLEPLIGVLPNVIPLAPKAKSFLAKANTPLPDRLQDYNFLHRFSPNEVFSDAVVAQINQSQPLTLLRDTYWSPENASELDRMLYLDWQYTLADNDLRKVSRMCDLAGIDVRYPLLDESLVDFSCSLPDQWKLKPGDLRHFFKKTLRGWLPDATIDKQKHGFGLPFGLWMQRYKPLSELAYDSVTRLKKSGYFREEFLDRIIHLHRDEHATYYGELIWILTILDLWLAGRSDNSAP